MNTEAGATKVDEEAGGEWRHRDAPQPPGTAADLDNPLTQIYKEQAVLEVARRRLHDVVGLGLALELLGVDLGPDVVEDDDIAPGHVRHQPPQGLALGRLLQGGDAVVARGVGAQLGAALLVGCRQPAPVILAALDDADDFVVGHVTEDVSHEYIQFHINLYLS